MIVTEGTPMTIEEKSIPTALRYEALFRLKMYGEMNIEISQALNEVDITIFASTEMTQTPELVLKLDFFVSIQLLFHEVKLMSGHGQDALESLINY